MFQLIINTNLLREIDERKLINTYARLVYNDKDDIEDDDRITNNLIQLLDWDKNGELGLGIYCSKFERIKRKDWIRLITFVKEHAPEIEALSRKHVRNRILENNKIVYDNYRRKRAKQVARFTNPDYKVSGKGKKARPCYYKGKYYKSTQECEHKEQISRPKLYKYLKETGQL